MTETLSIRVDADNPRHHLWLNGSSWWIHYTVHTTDGRQRRVRYSLETAELDEARALRGAVFAAWTEPRPALEIGLEEATRSSATSSPGRRATALARMSTRSTP